MITRNSRVGDLLKNPIAQDVLGRLSQYAGVSEKLLLNPIIRSLKLSAIPKFAGKSIQGADSVIDTMIDLFNQEEGTKLPAPSDSRVWWKEAVVYQIYPRSFMDGNGDGVGDIPGIIEKLDYLHELGVTALWLSPIFESPNDDNGYDVSDYRAIMKEFGTMRDVEKLIKELHKREMRLILDLVVNHTSDEHEWFIDSVKHPQGKHGDYYIWRKPKADGQPPNNWKSFFSGGAWEAVEGRDEMYLHLFSKKQPDLNWENPAVRDDVCAIIDFWREKGVDGFRLDVINYISKTSLEDGNETLGSLLGFEGIEHYFYGKRLHEFLKELRARAFGEAFTVGETPGTGPAMNQLLTADERGELNTVFSFDHLENQGKSRYDVYRYNLNHLKRCFIGYESAFADVAWPSIFVENHDNPRMVSKIDPREEYRLAIAKLLAVLLLTARGTVFLYQGQELGAVNVPFSGMSELRDIESLNRYKTLIESGIDPQTAWQMVLNGTRDHARTPMQWTSGQNGGFSACEPWIRVGDKDVCNAEAQMQDETSAWSAYQSLIALRREHPALVYGKFEVVEEKKEDVFCYFRDDGQERFYIEVNLCSRLIKRPKQRGTMQLIFSNYMASADAMEPYEANVYCVDRV
ncbi:MAG TPA: alpha-glucosidase [Feifaniaceae bacterium]|nr:alpha-glucosidase [Feifaniaceae bacterium]